MPDSIAENSASAFHDASGLVLATSARPSQSAAPEKQRMPSPPPTGMMDYAVYVLDTAGNIISWDAGAERMKGYHAREVIGRHYSCFFTPEDVQRGLPHSELQIAQSEGKYEAAGWRIRKDGSRFRAHVLVTALRDAEGLLRGFAKVTRDLTSEYRAQEVEQALLESETRTRAILDAAVDAIITIDEQGHVESFNPAAERLFGYSATELTGQNINRLMPSPYCEEHDTYLSNYRSTGEKKIIGIGREVVGLRKDGSTFPMDLAVSEVRLGDRRLFTGVVRDISERHKAEADLKSLAFQFQERNAELVRSNQELDDFAYIASHDLKEPLRGIHNYASFLIEDYGEQLNDDARAKLATLTRLTHAMESLLDSLLEYSRVGRLDLAIGKTDLNEVLSEVLDTLRISLLERDVAVRILRPLPTIECDRVRVAEVFRNLITNAMKYNQNAEKWIEIGFEISPCSTTAMRRQPSNLPAGAPVFFVRDNGIGIQEKYFETIFRIFKRLHGREKFGGGTGVGLTIVKKIIERHGGQIWVDSALGTGTTFYFTLTGETA